MTNDLLDLDELIAFVTGAGHGAGRGIALAFSAHNPSGVAVNDRGSVDAAFHKLCEALGPVTLLVNNVGNAGSDDMMGYLPPFWKTNHDQWNRFFAKKLRGVMNCCYVARPR